MLLIKKDFPVWLLLVCHLFTLNVFATSSQEKMSKENLKAFFMEQLDINPNRLSKFNGNKKRALIDANQNHSNEYDDVSEQEMKNIYYENRSHDEQFDEPHNIKRIFYGKSN